MIDGAYNGVVVAFRRPSTPGLPPPILSPRPRHFHPASEAACLLGGPSARVRLADDRQGAVAGLRKATGCVVVIAIDLLRQRYATRRPLTDCH